MTTAKRTKGFDGLAERLEERYGIEAVQCGDPDIVDIVAPVDGSILRIWADNGERTGRARYRVKIGLNPPTIVNTLAEVMQVVVDRLPE
jgi:hypothetical protein